MLVALVSRFWAVSLTLFVSLRASVQAISDPAEEAKRKAKRAELRKAQKKKRTAAFAAQKERFGEGSKRRRTDE